ncbi:MAG: UTP--glucose-1-phosphate uridylyltransferase, partial [Thermodesulfobacteriota bacterium]
FYRYFNTNNIWLNLCFVKEFLEKEGNILLPLILNPKRVDPRNDNSPGVFQIESAIGAAISIFPGASAVIVPKDRLIPVKKCNDLLLVESDCFVLNSEGRLVWNPNKKQQAIRIDLDSAFYGKIDRLNARFNEGIPSLLNCDALTIIGDVRFESNVAIHGTVRIENQGPAQAVINKGSVIDRDLTFF